MVSAHAVVYIEAIDHRARCLRSRRCCTGCAAIATRCTRIPTSRPPQDFPGPSCTGCAYGMTCKPMLDTLLDGDGFRAVVTAPERDNAVALAGVELIPAQADRVGR